MRQISLDFRRAPTSRARSARAPSLVAGLALGLACQARTADQSVRHAARAEASGSAPLRAGESSALGVRQSTPGEATPGSVPERASTRCPAEMAFVERPQGSFCIDRWEASLERRTAGRRELWPGNRTIDGLEADLFAVSVAGRKPQGYVSADQAARACANAGKRLCELDEWTRACRGAADTRYPYGDERRPDVCNDRFALLEAHPVVRLFESSTQPGTPRSTMWQPAFLNDPRLHELPRTVEPTGARSACTNELSVYDLVGNLHEWIADPEGTFVGGFFMDTFQNGEGCDYRTTAHPRDYHDYSTGFRCCRDAE